MEIKNQDEYWQAANRLEELRQVPYCKHAVAREALWQEYWELEKAVRQYLSDNPKKDEPTFTLADMKKAFDAGVGSVSCGDGGVYHDYGFSEWIKGEYADLD